MTFDLPDVAATEALGRALVQAMPRRIAGWVILLRGELGSGKTTVARAWLRAMGHQGPVPSPTYTLVEPYELPRGKVYHIDLYRIADESELPFLGWDEFGDGLALIEWPERAPRVSRAADLDIRLVYAGEGRRVTVEGLTERATSGVGADLAAALAAAGISGAQSGQVIK